MRYYFRRFVLDRRTGTLKGADGHTVSLPRQACALLAVLVDHHPNLVTRDALIDHVWGPGHASPDSLPQALGELRRALGDNARHPRFVQTVHRRGYRFIAPVAFSPAREVEPRGVHPSEERHSNQPLAGVGRRVGLAASIVLALTIAGVVRFGPHDTQSTLLASTPTMAPTSLGMTPTSPGAQRDVEPTPTVAILGFDNLGQRDQDAWLDAALGEMLATELALHGELRVIDRETLHTLSSGGFARTPTADDPEPNLVQLGLEIGADFVLRGRYRIRGGNPTAGDRTDGDSAEVRLDVRLIDTASGDHVTRVQRARATDALIDLVADVGETLRLRLMPHAVLRAQRVPSSHAAPRPHARPTYFAGLAALHRNDLRNALQLLGDASALDPHSHAVESALASVLAALGHEQQAREAADRAWRLGKRLGRRLPDRDRKWLEARRHELHGRHDLALDVYRDLTTEHPHVLPYHLRLVTTLITRGQTRDALTHLELVRRHAPAPAVRTHLDLLEKRATASLPAPHRQDEAAARPGLVAQCQCATTIRWPYTANTGAPTGPHAYSTPWR